MNRDVIPVVDVLFRGLYQFQLFLWIIYQGTEFLLLALTYVITKELINLSLDIARGVFENMPECLIFAVKVGHKMFSAFWQVENCFEIDNLATCSGNRREGLR